MATHFDKNKLAKGQRFNQLTIVEDLGLQYLDKWPRRISAVKALCSCGTECVAPRRAVTSGHKKSCGCAVIDQARSMGKGTAKEKGHRAFMALYAAYTRRAAKRGLIFSLNLDQFRELTGAPCVYCQAAPHEAEGYAWNGIDRLNSDFGYSADNCVSCCFVCNRAKMNMSVTDWETYLHRLGPDSAYRPVGWVSIERIVDAFGKIITVERAIRYGWIKINPSKNVYAYDSNDQNRLELGPNLFVDQGRQALCYLFAFRSPIQNFVCSQFGVGTGTSPAKTTDVSLQAPVALASSSYTGPIDSADFLSAFVTRIAFTLGLNDASGSLITEMGLFSGNNTLLARRVRSVGINKSSDFSPTISWRLRF